jgi:nucleoside-diphosphate-sugar epimerase
VGKLLPGTSLAWVRETHGNRKASHRGLGGHRGRSGVVGKLLPGTPLAWVRESRGKEKYRTEVSEATEGDPGRWGNFCLGHPRLHPALPGPELSVGCVMPRSVLIAGCGFVGLPLAQMFVSTGWETAALTASETSAASLHGQPFPVHALDITENDSFRHLARRRFDVVIHCASSGRGDANAYTAVFLAGTRNLMTNLVYERLIFTSSTSVYAQQDGSWVDETSPADPAPKTGQILRETEDLVLASKGTVARLGGLYGPGRCAPLKKLMEERASLEEDGARTMNTLHQLDAAAALHFLAGTESRGLFNVVDNEPVTEIEWFRYVCQRLNKPLPPSGPRNLDRKRGWTNKRVSNRRLRSLGWSLNYPTFREGLASMLGGDLGA